MLAALPCPASPVRAVLLAARHQSLCLCPELQALAWALTQDAPGAANWLCDKNTQSPVLRKLQRRATTRGDVTQRGGNRRPHLSHARSPALHGRERRWPRGQHCCGGTTRHVCRVFYCKLHIKYCKLPCRGFLLISLMEEGSHDHHQTLVKLCESTAGSCFLPGGERPESPLWRSPEAVTACPCIKFFFPPLTIMKRLLRLCVYFSPITP